MSGVTVHHGDSREVLKTFADSSIDSCVCDPPYSLVSIQKRFGKPGSAPVKLKKLDGQGGSPYARGAKGFMGQQWDNGDTAFDPEFWVEVLRVLKPGSHLVAFGGTRTYHRLACAIEDAGFEIRDQIGWLYGSGFPKSHDVSKGIDRALGCERSKVRIDAAQVRNPKVIGAGRDGLEGASRPFIESAMERGYHEAVSDEAVIWHGWGTALKPAWEPIVLARKPIIGTVAANVLQHRTGALNIDDCRIGFREGRPLNRNAGSIIGANGHKGDQSVIDGGEGRWPANIVHDGSCEVLAQFPDSDGQQGDVCGSEPSHTGDKNTVAYGEYGRIPFAKRDDGGSAARFFYTAKADSDERVASKHPTVKPIDLMQWLVRLVTPRGGLVLDPFAGSGTTGEASWREGMRAILIEREDQYVQDINRRLELMRAGPDERSRQIIKAKNLPEDHGPLFGGTDLAQPASQV